MTNNKTPEQIKREQFDQNPDNFVHIKDLIVGVERQEKGFRFMIGNALESEYHQVRSRLDLAFMNMFNKIEEEKRREAKMKRNILMRGFKK